MPETSNRINLLRLSGDRPDAFWVLRLSARPRVWMLSKSQGSAAADSTPTSRWFPHAPFPLVISAGQSSKLFGLTREINVFLNLPTRFSVQVRSPFWTLATRFPPHSPSRFKLSRRRSSVEPLQIPTSQPWFWEKPKFNYMKVCLPWKTLQL